MVGAWIANLVPCHVTKIVLLMLLIQDRVPAVATSSTVVRSANDLQRLDLNMGHKHIVLVIDSEAICI